MNQYLRSLLLVCLALALGAGPVPAQTREAATMEESLAVLDAFTAITKREIPTALLRNAQGIVIVPNVFKAGFIVGGRHGRGVLLVREPDGSWGRPTFLALSGGGIGFQAGVQSTDVVLVFKTRSSLDRIQSNKITLGADVAIAAGPIGRQAEAATDAQLKAEIYSYSRSRGLFVGVSLEGAGLTMDFMETQAYYRQEPSSWTDPRTGKVVPVVPPSARLQMKLSQLTGPVDGTGVPEPPPVHLAPMPVPVPTKIEPPPAPPNWAPGPPPPPAK